MSVLGLVAVVLVFGAFLRLAVYLPANREGRSLSDRNNRHAAIPVSIPIPVPVDRSGTSRPEGR